MKEARAKMITTFLIFFFFLTLPVGENNGIIMGGGDIIPGITFVGEVMFVIGVNPGWVPLLSWTPLPPPLIF